MTQTRTQTPAPGVPRDQLIAHAVVSAYLNELSGVWRSAEGAPDARGAVGAAM